ncbi:hypothetical protein SAMN05421595_1316 [Austwickia chelonae]|uniref:DUF1795 domain-containing protein n=1 Tax=Austwickia chelonae NBRC 105200 TaxID=1184607 RepID=K6VQ50_9MICO|nr:hypothetical protein [Austwickia chelonae]GAB77480.1 hypothetical protein AUCHE_05_03920 [Austwickia chelonae NBRC 105200]SEW11250.1 hypothetical protein SAMN05421595_1316 [Austwickia chelonae]
MRSTPAHTHTDTTGDLTLAVPADWETLDDDTLSVGITLAVVAPCSPELEFRPNAVLTRSDIGHLSLTQWQENNEQILAERLTAYTPLDRFEEFTNGVVTDRRLADYVSPEGINVTMAQWSRARAGRGVTLTVTMATSDVPANTDLLDQIGDSFHWVDQA